MIRYQALGELGLQPPVAKSTTFYMKIGGRGTEAL